MIKFEGKILQFGFGAVGKSFFEKLGNEIIYDENKYYVITRDKTEFEAYINMGGIASNFYTYDINKANFEEIFSKFIGEGDILIDFADTVGTKDILIWCAENNIMYLNTGEADWPENWYNIFDEFLKKKALINSYKEKREYNKYPIVLHHGNNPGLVSHFVKAAIEYIVLKQFKSDKNLKKLLKENKFNEIAKSIGIRMIHVNDIDLQKTNFNYIDNNLSNTWCIDSFFFELLSEATQNLGTHEDVSNLDFKALDKERGFLEYKKLAFDLKCGTYYPNGYFNGYLVPHEETITIASSLEVIEDDKVIYRPSTMFIYKPCSLAEEYLSKSKVNSYPDFDINKPLDDNEKIVRGHIYPFDSEILYKEKIKEGTEYVGVLILGDKFDPVWVGNRVELSFLYKKKNSYWQTPTITPVAMSALSVLCWMIKNKEKGGIYFPENIDDYKYIIKKSEKYISKTIYKTFKRNLIEEKLNIDFSNIQTKDFIIKE